MPTSLSFDTAHRDDGQLVLIAVGEIDLSNIEEFERVLASTTTEAVSAGGTLLVDLSAVEYLDSAAISALVSHADHIHVIAHPLMMTVFRISGLTELATVEAAPPPAEY